MRCSADFSKKRVGWDEKGQDLEHSKDQETRIEMPRGTPKTQYSAKILRREFRISGGARQLRKPPRAQTHFCGSSHLFRHLCLNSKNVKKWGFMGFPYGRLRGYRHCEARPKINFNKFAHESTYISNTFSRESPRFFNWVHSSQNSIWDMVKCLDPGFG